MQIQSGGIGGPPWKIKSYMCFYRNETHPPNTHPGWKNLDAPWEMLDPPLKPWKSIVFSEIKPLINNWTPLQKTCQSCFLAVRPKPHPWQKFLDPCMRCESSLALGGHEILLGFSCTVIFHRLEDLTVLKRSPDLFNNVKIGQDQLRFIMKHILFYGGYGHWQSKWVALD